MAPPLLSIIIPTLNEAENLPALLADLNKQQNMAVEIIVGDGGSTDATRQIAEQCGAGFVATGRGRGLQMNAAASKATGKYLLFLHADSRIDDSCLLFNAVRFLQHEQGETPLAGHFRLRFIRSQERNNLAYRFAEEKTALNRVNTTNGDQGLLLSTDFFRRLGGFDESLPFLEDQRIAEKIRAQGRWLTLPGHLKTSARRFEAEGLHRRYILMSIMMGLHNIGETGFFRQAPGVYRTQQETGRLLLAPFFSLLWRMTLEEWGFTGTLRTFYRLGRYIRQNSWQLFFFCDVCLRSQPGKGRYPFLRFHDRFFGPCTDFAVCNALVGAVSFLWFMGVLAAYFSISDYRQVHIGAPGSQAFRG